MYLCPQWILNLLCDRGQQGEVLKPTKNVIFKYFNRFGHFSQFLSQVKDWDILE